MSINSELIIMNLLIAFCLGVFLFLLPFSNKVKAETINTDDLLIPEIPSKNDKTVNNQQLAHKPKEEKDIDNLLGPKDIFPFLAENHRDSGAIKFHSF